jgi:hypothetical protein
MKNENEPIFSERELLQAVYRTKIRSANGPDGISNRLIKLAYENPQFRTLVLAAINNTIFKAQTFPQELKNARTVPLPKPKPVEF